MVSPAAEGSPRFAVQSNAVDGTATARHPPATALRATAITDVDAAVGSGVARYRSSAVGVRVGWRGWCRRAATSICGHVNRRRRQCRRGKCDDSPAAWNGERRLRQPTPPAVGRGASRSSCTRTKRIAGCTGRTRRIAGGWVDCLRGGSESRSVLGRVAATFERRSIRHKRWRRFKCCGGAATLGGGDREPNARGSQAWMSTMGAATAAGSAVVVVSARAGAGEPAMARPTSIAS